MILIRLFLLLVVGYSTAQDIHKIIAHQSLKLPIDVVQQIRSIVDLVENAQTKDMLSALYCLKYYLQHNLAIMYNASVNDRDLVNKKFIINCRLEHIEHAIRRYKRNLSWWERSHHYLEHAYQSLQHRRSSNAQWTCTSHPLAHALAEYIAIEDHYFLINYQKALTFFALCNKYDTFPFAISFWSNPSLQKDLACRLQILTHTKVTPQAQALTVVGEFIANQAIHLAPVALQATLMGGQSMYGQWISKKAQKKVAELAAQQKALSTSYQEFITQRNKQQENKVNSIVKNFSSAQKSINASYESFAHKEQQNYAYLLQSINLEQPKSHYLMYPISFDQLFCAGIMNTPLSDRYPWYNVYQDLSGNWAYDQGYFYQRSLVDYGTPYWAKGSSNPEAIAIFNEWYTDQVPYKLSIEMRLIQVSYPFFIGIMFNKARWISGDPESLNRYRLLGIQADSINDFSFWFAEPTISFKQGLEKIVTPLEHIATKKGQLLKTINPLIASGLATDNITYHIELSLGSTTIKYVIKTSQTVVAMGILSNLDQTMNRYHGFGFIAAGCRARFKILEPLMMSQGL